MALLRCANIPKSTFYYYEEKNKNQFNKHAEIELQIVEIFMENKGRYGYRRITAELRNRGLIVNHKLVLKLMHKLNLHCKIRRKRYNSYIGSVGKAAENILNRNFKADKPNRKWTTDVSEFSIPAGKLFLSPILDMFNGEIISYNISNSPNLHQTFTMLDDAFIEHENLNGLIFHSDQGWQYQNKRYHEKLIEKGIIQSMSRKGTCLDNAIMENFFGIMKTEMFYGHEKEFGDLEDLKLAMMEYLDYYNHKRIKLRLNGMSPVQYRKNFEKFLA